MHSQLSCFFRNADWRFWGWLIAIAGVAIAQVSAECLPPPWWLKKLIVSPAFTAAVVASMVFVVRDRYRSIRDICRAGRILFEMDGVFDDLTEAIGRLMEDTRRFQGKVKALSNWSAEHLEIPITVDDFGQTSINELSRPASRFEADVVLIESLLDGVMFMRQKREDVSALKAAWFDMLHLRTLLSLLILGGPPRLSFSPMPGADNKAFFASIEEFIGKLQHIKRLTGMCRHSASQFARLIADGKLVATHAKRRTTKSPDSGNGR